jgi:ATP-dependent RNA helicase DDX41
MVTTMSNGRHRSTSPSDDDSYDIPEDYTPYVPVAKRRKQLLSKLESRKKTAEEIEQDRLERLREEEDEERQREKARRERTLLQQAQEVKERKARQGGCKRYT